MVFDMNGNLLLKLKARLVCKSLLLLVDTLIMIDDHRYATNMCYKVGTMTHDYNGNHL